MKKTLYLMRHGQTLFNARKKIQGWCDAPLTELGIKQAKIAGKYFKDNNIVFDHAYSSTSERACDTLELVCDLPYHRVKGLKEWNFGIYEGDTMVGYVMVIYDYDIPEYDIWHMMIDESNQRRGYGKSALDCVLDYIKAKPFGSSNRVTLTCNKDNIQALNLYKSRGFTETGAADEDEIELSLMMQ